MWTFLAGIATGLVIGFFLALILFCLAADAFDEIRHRVRHRYTIADKS